MVELTATRRIFRCRMEDASLPGGSGEVVVNAAHIVWACAHPHFPDKTLIKLVGENVLIVLVPIADMAVELCD
jgi:hypothetical protein